MIPPMIQPLIRRAILDLLNDIGGEQNDDYIQILLRGLGHRLARRDIVEQLKWLAERGLVAVEVEGEYHVARILADGRDIANGNLKVEGVRPHKTGD